MTDRLCDAELDAIRIRLKGSIAAYAIAKEAVADEWGAGSAVMANLERFGIARMNEDMAKLIDEVDRLREALADAEPDGEY